ncbi:response regulator [Microvirga antarctica]|uniref:response regulator n=1 Tax=Microvirga antarctica TaxID=2819233 RepID=UPI001B302EC4|nr:response regulator [Microvirga antarctica]
MHEDQSTVLLVEDEPLIRLFLSELLEESGFKVIEAANAVEALTILEAGREVTVMLTDVDMPAGRSGFELARTVSKCWPHIEILIMSGRQWPARGDLPAGAAFLAKPCPNETIVAHVESAVLRTRRLSQPDAAPNEAGSAEILPFPKTA